MLLDQPSSLQRERIALPPLLVFALVAVFVLVAAAVSHRAPGAAFDYCRRAAVQDHGHCRADGVDDDFDIVAVDLLIKEAVAFAAMRDRTARGDRFDRRRHAPAVVLAQKNNWQLVDGRHVQALVKDALIGRAVAEETDHDMRRVALRERVGEARRDGNSARGDSVRAHEADVNAGHVLRAALAAAVAFFAAVEFGHDPKNVAAFGDEMSVPAMIADDQIVFRQRRACADRDGFLPDGAVKRSG